MTARAPGFFTITVARSVRDDVAERGRRALFADDSTELLQAGDWLHVSTICANATPPTDLVLAEVLHVARDEWMMAKGGDRRLVSLGMVGFLPMLEMRLPRCTLSLKNRRSVHAESAFAPVERDGKVWLESRVRAISRKSKAQRTDVEMVRGYAAAAIATMRGRARGPNGQPFADDDAIELRCYPLIGTDEMVVRALRVGTLPDGRKAKKGTKRDVHGVVELVADALQGVWFGDDRQIDRASQERVR